MRYSDNYDDDDDDDDDDDVNIEAEMMADALSQSNKNREAEMQLASMQFQDEMMTKAISICKSDWFWGFLSHNVKINRIAETYKALLQIIEG